MEGSRRHLRKVVQWHLSPITGSSVLRITVELAMIISKSRKKSGLAASKVSVSCLPVYLLLKAVAVN